MFKVGDKVVFGRSHGEQTAGTVVKVNSTTVVVAQDEVRGQTRIRAEGTKWKVPFALCRLANGAALAPAPFALMAPAAKPFKAGDTVSFAARGTTFTGTVVSVNTKTVSVNTPQGNWRVGPGLLTKVNGASSAPTTPDKFAALNPFVKDKRPDDVIMADILNCYCGLSPENLFMDGEASRAQAMARKRSLEAKLNGLFYEIGRKVSEDAAYAWDRTKRAA